MGFIKEGVKRDLMEKRGQESFYCISFDRWNGLSVGCFQCLKTNEFTRFVEVVGLVVRPHAYFG